MAVRYSEHYIWACKMIEAEASERLGRHLSSQEHRGIWNAGSLESLNRIERLIETTNDAAALAANLQRYAESFESQRRMAVGKLIFLAEEALSRRLTDAEETYIRSLETVDQALVMLDALTEAHHVEREMVFTQMVCQQ